MTEIDPGVWEALHTGFMLPEMVIWGGDRKTMDRYMTDAAHAHPEAFHDGASLKKQALFVFTSDQPNDFETDIRNYDAVVAFLNDKYGKIAIPFEEASKGYPLALGLIGYRYCPWETVTTQTGTEEVSVEFPSEKVTMDDENTRRQ